jgi:hypothetical protein
MVVPSLRGRSLANVGVWLSRQYTIPRYDMLCSAHSCSKSEFSVGVRSRLLPWRFALHCPLMPDWRIIDVRLYSFRRASLLLRPPRCMPSRVCTTRARISDQYQSISGNKCLYYPHPPPSPCIQIELLKIGLRPPLHHHPLRWAFDCRNHPMLRYTGLLVDLLSDCLKADAHREEDAMRFRVQALYRGRGRWLAIIVR